LFLPYLQVPQGAVGIPRRPPTGSRWTTERMAKPMCKIARVNTEGCVRGARACSGRRAPLQDRAGQLNRYARPRTWVPPMVFGNANEWHDFAAAIRIGQLAVPSVPVVGIDSTDESLRGDPARRSPTLTSAEPIVCRRIKKSDVLAPGVIP
jgi:hypothetical protein